VYETYSDLGSTRNTDDPACLAITSKLVQASEDSRKRNSYSDPELGNGSYDRKSPWNVLYRVKQAASILKRPRIWELGSHEVEQESFIHVKVLDDSVEAELS
jgi:hypothetical protein